MKRLSFWLGLAVLLVFVLPVNAKPEHIVLGPYNVTFDAGKELQDWNITKKETETLMGSPEVDYHAVSPDDDVRILINWFDFKKGESFTSIDEWRKSTEENIKAMGGVCDSYPRVIDGRDGFVASIYYKEWSYFEAGWHLNNNTNVLVTSFYSWDEGTLRLLKTINVTMTE